MAHKLGSMTQPLQKLPKVTPVNIDQDALAAYFSGRQVITSRRKALPREATIGPIVFDKVTKLIETGMKKSDAFHIVAADLVDKGADEETVEKKARSVATTFYRLQRLAADGEAPPAPVAVAEASATAPKRRGRPPKAKVTEPVNVIAGNGHQADVMQALGQAKAAIDQAIERQREEAAELAELREFKAKAASILG